jgi:IS66 Orf2 like protein
VLIVPAGVKVHLALGYTDMRKGMDGLAMLVQDVLKKDPFSGHLFAFRGKKASMLKILFWDGNGLVHQADRPGTLCPAGDGGLRRFDHADAGTACDADRRHRLART